MRVHAVDPMPEHGMITDVRPLPSDPNYRRVSVDGRAVARLRAGDVESLGLSPGRRWTAALAAGVCRCVASAAAHAEAMRLLARRAYSRRELVDRLERRHSKEAAESVVDELVRSGWLDDRVYADDLASAAEARRPAAAGFLERRLLGRGIEPEIARRAAQRATAHRTDLDAAVAHVASSRARAPGRGGAAAEARRLAAALARRGFDDDTIRLALDRVGLASADEWT